MPAAVANAQRAVLLDPVSTAENYFLALMHVEAADLPAAERVCLRLLELEPRYSPALSVLGDVHRLRGETDKAATFYLESARVAGTQASSLTRRMEALRRGGLSALREEEMRDMIDSWDGWHFAAYLISQRHTEFGKSDAALA